MEDERVTIKRWRQKAEEIRTAYDGFDHGSARAALLQVAESYETMANNLESRLTGMRPKELKDAG